MQKIITGDACRVLPELPSASCQAVIVDPPYYNVLTDEKWDTQWDSEEAYLTWSLRWVRECMRVLKEDGLFFCFGQLGKREHVFIHLMSRLCDEFQFHDLIIWDRAVGYNERRDSFTPAYEMILVLRKSDTVKFIKDAVRVPYDEQTIAAYLKDTRYKDKAARQQHLLAGKYETNLIWVERRANLN
jgi:site-specific DNA-methyltransferase (adenine-specific)